MFAFSMDFFVDLANLISHVFYRMLFMSISAAAVGMVIMLIRWFADKKFSPFWKYSIWILVLAALVIPWRPQSNLAVMNKAEVIQNISFKDEFTQSQYNREVIKAEIRQNQDEASNKILETPWGENVRGTPEQEQRLNAAIAKSNELRTKMIIFDYILPFVWLCGALASALFMLICGIRLKHKIKKSEITLKTSRYEDILQQCKGTLGIKRRVRIIMQKHVKTPSLFGLFYPKIILPEYVSNLSDSHLEYIILHELSHMKRWDGIINLLLLALQTIYWFNPLTWFLFKFIREDMELANDASVLKGMNKEERKEYSLSLVEVLAGYGKPELIPRLLCMVDNEKNIERRINMIKLGEFFKKRKLIIGIISIVVIAAVSIMFLTVGSALRTEPTYAEATYTEPKEIPTQSLPTQTSMQYKDIYEGEHRTLSEWLMYAPTDAKNFSPSPLLTLEPKTKADYYHKMINTVDYFTYASGEYESNWIIDEGAAVEFQVDMSRCRAYGHMKSSGVDEERYVQSFRIFDFDNINKTAGTITEAAFDGMFGLYVPADDERMWIDEDGYSNYHGRADTTNLFNMSGYGLFPQNLAMGGYFSNHDLWEIAEKTEYLGRPCAVLKGKPEEYFSGKHNVDHFVVIIDDETGVWLKFEGFDKDGSPTLYMTTTKFSTQKTDVKSIDISKYESYMNYNDSFPPYVRPSAADFSQEFKDAMAEVESNAAKEINNHDMVTSVLKLEYSGTSENGNHMIDLFLSVESGCEEADAKALREMFKDL